MTESLARLIRLYKADYLVLAESPYKGKDLCKYLRDLGGGDFQFLPGPVCRKIQIFSRHPAKYHSVVLESDRLTIREIRLPDRTRFNLAATHFPSKLHYSAESQALECSTLSGNITIAESKVGHARTLLVGDLNMNPFESGIVGAGGLHAVMSRQIAARRQRTVNARQYQFFYNPMWSLFGDMTPGPPGTFYYYQAEHVTYFWNMFDQVLVRPDLMESFQGDALKIIESDGIIPFLGKQGLPVRRTTSDHLPIQFQLNI